MEEWEGLVLVLAPTAKTACSKLTEFFGVLFADSVLLTSAAASRCIVPLTPEPVRSRWRMASEEVVSPALRIPGGRLCKAVGVSALIPRASSESPLISLPGSEEMDSSDRDLDNNFFTLAFLAASTSVPQRFLLVGRPRRASASRASRANLFWGDRLPATSATCRR